jgi:hypothetical protein
MAEPNICHTPDEALADRDTVAMTVDSRHVALTFHILRMFSW